MPSAHKNLLKVDRSTKTLRELTLEKMRGAIFNGHFQPGTRLVERQLCEQLDVSRSVVREVLRHLETEGLIETIPHQGPIVASMDADRAAQIYEIRALLEGQAARLCAEKASDEAIEHLASLNDDTQEAFRKNDFQAVLARTSIFYKAMFTAAGFNMAWDIVQSLNARINQLRAMTISSTGRCTTASDEMARIVKALRDRDPQAAQDASQAHVRRAAEIASQRLTASGK